jgi:hypothetical protein
MEDGVNFVTPCPQICHRRPKLQGQRQCGQTCVDEVKVSCLVCKLRPKDGKQDLCSLVCKKVAMKLAPLILEVPRNHTVFDMGTYACYHFDGILTYLCC